MLFGIVFAVGAFYVLTRVIRYPKVPVTPLDIAKKYFLWTSAMAGVPTLANFIAHPDAAHLASWALAMSFFVLPISFLGWAGGKFFVLKKEDVNEKTRLD